MSKDYKKRYWVYVIEEYYPSGGINDVEETFDNLSDAENLYDHWISSNSKDEIWREVSIWDMVERCEIKSNRL